MCVEVKLRFSIPTPPEDQELQKALKRERFIVASIKPTLIGVTSPYSTIQIE